MGEYFKEITLMAIYKIAIVGDGGVGKSSILEAKKNKTFCEDRPITIGVDFKIIPLEQKDENGQAQQFLTMDLGGQDRFQFIHGEYIKGIKGAIILFDVSRIRTFDNIRKWHSLVRDENTEIPILIVGNKVDLVETSNVDLFKNDLDELIKDLPGNNIYGYFFTSAKDCQGIKETFTICEEMIINQLKHKKKVSQSV